jgi:hypothetical protein
MKAILLAAVITVMAFGQEAYAQNDKASLFKGVITSYLDLKNFLTQDAADSAGSAAERLRVAVNSLPTDSLTPVENTVWTKYKEKLGHAAEQIKNAGDIDGQRKSFEELSAAMYAILEKAKANSVALYYDYYPMAKAYRISEKADISNPYLGQMMPTCGSIKDTISVH